MIGLRRAQWGLWARAAAVVGAVAVAALPPAGCAPARAGGGGAAGDAPARAGGGGAAGDAPARRGAGAAAEERGVGSGTLRQDQISVRMTAGDLRIEITPLAPWALAAAAPDTRARLERLAASRGPALARHSGDDDPILFLVTFSSIRPGTEFQPDDLHLVSRGLRERPLAVDPVSPGWGSRRLDQQASAAAIYAFSGSVDLSRDLAVSYQGREDSSWSGIAAAIEAERGRIPG